MTTVDLIVPCYNYGDMLDACVRSILDQEHVRVRVLIMDDASSDTTEQVGRRLAASDPRVEYRRHAQNQGHIATYNEALALVTADYCMLLSADDLLTPGALSRATRVMNTHQEVGLTYGRDITFQFAPPLGVARHVNCCSHRISAYHEFLGRSCRLGHTPIQAPTVVVRTSLHRKIGDYRADLPHTADTEIWLRMAAHAAVCELDADQAFRRLHTNNMSLGYSPLRRLEQQKKAFDAHFALYAAERPEIVPLHAVVNRTIAESAVWSAAHAFDAGDARLCESFLAFASATCAEITSWHAWQRLGWKRRLGPSMWSALAGIVAVARRGAHLVTASAPVQRAGVTSK